MEGLQYVLLIEDNPIEAKLVKQAWERLNIIETLLHANNCEQALEILNHSLPKGHGIILLDLSLPTMHGFDFLAQIKSIKRFTLIPVIIFSSSWNQNDISKGYQLGASSYILKSSIYSELESKIRILVEYWKTIEFPELES